MPLDFQEVRKQIRELSSSAQELEKKKRDLREAAQSILMSYANKLEYLRDKALRAASLDQYFRAALPVNEPLNASFPLPEMPAQATLIAADGSQINPDRHMGVEYCLVNVGAIQLRLGEATAPVTTIDSKLFYGEQVFSMQEKTVALIRDMSEREILAKLAAEAPKPVITLTDGPIELWGKEVSLGEEEQALHDKYHERYLKALGSLHSLDVAHAGYVDKPRSDLLVRLLEIAPQDKPEKDARKNRWLKNLPDIDVLWEHVKPGERSAIFGLLTKSSQEYDPEFRVHFFYLNVALQGKKEIVRVEIPGWVAEQPLMVDALHAVLVQQCQVVSTKCYPYLLTRADETAVVSRDEKRQVDQMIARELRQQGLDVAEKSQKQQSKEVARGKPKRKKGI